MIERTLYYILFLTSMTLSTTTTYLLLRALLPSEAVLIAVCATICLQLGQYLLAAKVSSAPATIMCATLLALSVSATAIQFNHALDRADAHYTRQLAKQSARVREQQAEHIASNAQLMTYDNQIATLSAKSEQLLLLAESDRANNYRQRAASRLAEIDQVQQQISALTEARAHHLQSLRLNEQEFKPKQTVVSPLFADASPTLRQAVVWILAILLDCLPIWALREMTSAKRKPRGAWDGEAVRQNGEVVRQNGEAVRRASPSFADASPSPIQNTVNVHIENKPIQTLTLVDQIARGDFGPTPSANQVFKETAFKRDEVRDAFKEASAQGKLVKIGNKWHVAPLKT